MIYDQEKHSISVRDKSGVIHNSMVDCASFPSSRFLNSPDIALCFTPLGATEVQDSMVFALESIRSQNVPHLGTNPDPAEIFSPEEVSIYVNKVTSEAYVSHEKEI